MQTARVSRIGTFATILAMATLLFGALGVPVAQADEGLDAHRIMQAVNERYQSFFDDPRQVDIDQTVTVSSLDQADVTTDGDYVAHLKGDQARVEAVESDTVQEAFRGNADLDLPDSRRFVWVHSGQETKVLHESGFLDKQGEGRQPVVESFVIRHHALPEALPAKYRSPLRHLEFDDVFLNARFRAYAATLDGEPVYVLQSLEDVRANDGSLIRNCQFWIDARELLLVKLQMEVQEALPEGDQREPAYLYVEQDMRTQFGVQLEDDVFELALPKAHRDLTDMVHERIRANGHGG